MSGKYKILKETLKKPIIKIVKEKYFEKEEFRYSYHMDGENTPNMLTVINN